MLKVQKINNGSFEEEAALINVETNEVIVKGDYYHDKIDEYIDGFLYGLSYSGIDYQEIDEITVDPKTELFELCDFYDENCYDDEDEEPDDDCEDEEDDTEENTEDEVEIKEEPILMPHQIEHHFKIYADGTTRLYSDIIEALKKTRNCEGDLFCYDNSDEEIVCSCLGLECETNNDLLRPFGVYYDENNKLKVIE